MKGVVDLAAKTTEKSAVLDAMAALTLARNGDSYTKINSCLEDNNKQFDNGDFAAKTDKIKFGVPLGCKPGCLAFADTESDDSDYSDNEDV